MSDVYVYFRGDEARGDTLRALRALQSALTADLGIRGRIQLRRDEPTAPPTWMEIYPDVPPRQVASLLEARERLAIAIRLQPALPESVHVEVFDPVDTLDDALERDPPGTPSAREAR